MSKGELLRLCRMAQQDPFFQGKNETVLQRALYNDICRRIGGDLTEKQATRLVKTVKHYMAEVYRVQGPGKPLQSYNREVLAVTLPDYMSYLQRAQRSSNRSVMSDMSDEVHLPGEAEARPVKKAIEDRPREQLDVGAAFAQLQASRQDNQRPKQPAQPDFRVSLQEEGSVPIDVFERIKKEREDEVRRQSELLNQKTVLSGDANQRAFADAGDSFARDRRRLQEESEEIVAARERERLQARATAGQELMAALPPPPDMRAVFLGDTQQIARKLNTELVPVIPSNHAAGNPTTALPDPFAAPRETSAQQMIITREPSTMTYKETELNLFVYSGDRDWISNSRETRYDFSVSFDPANMPVGLRLQPTATVKFKNIVRIELVKAIMPGESVDTLVTRTYNGSAFAYSAPYNFNVLSFPYIQVRVPELDNNSYGTNQSLNAAFGVLQYDANWIYDTTNSNARGYFAMIPKFMKCQKVYNPTPLSTLNKLSFRFERPDGTLVSTIPDTLDVYQIYSSKERAASTGFPYGYDSAIENGTGAAYYFIRTSSYFNCQTVTKGDRIVVKNLAWSATPSGAAVSQLADFLTYLQSDAGLLVVDTGYGTSAAGITIGANTQGYCNILVVRGKFTDPVLGGTATSTLGGQADTSSPGSLTANTLSAFLSSNANATGRLLNQSHQVQVALRVIVRELDGTGFLRPDNL